MQTVVSEQPMVTTQSHTLVRNRAQAAGITAGVALLLAFHLLPAPAPMTTVGMGRVGVLAFAISWWICAPVPLAVTTLAALGIGVGTGALSLNEAFAASTSWIGWFLVGAFGLSTALEVNGFSRRFALWFVNHPWLRGRPYALLFMFLGSATLMSGVITNTVVTVAWLSLATTIYSALNLRKGHPYAEVNTLGIAWMTNIGGVLTPIGTPTNAVAIGLIAGATGTTLSFLTWTIIGSFAVLLLTASTFLVMRYLMRPDVSVMGGDETASLLLEQQLALGDPQPSERRAVRLFGVAIALWVLPDLLRLVVPEESLPTLARNMGLAVPALLVPTVMCLMPSGQQGRSRVLTWDEWSKGVDWGMILFIVGVLALGTAIGAPEAGVSEFLRHHVEPSVTGLPEFGFVFVLTMAVLLVTSVMSNQVTVAVLTPIGLTLSLSLGIGNPLALGVILGMAASLAYALPSGTATNAIVAGTGWLRIGVMARFGVVLMCLHALLLTFGVYPFAKYLLR